MRVLAESKLAHFKMFGRLMYVEGLFQNYESYEMHLVEIQAGTPPNPK